MLLQHNIVLRVPPRSAMFREIMLGEVLGGMIDVAKEPGRHRDNRLSAAGVKALGAGFHADGQGLYLKVEQSGARRWVQRIVIRGKRRDLGLGAPPVVSLKQAREKALDNRRVARVGGDPTTRPAPVPSFEALAKAVHRDLLPTWKSARHGEIWWRSLEMIALPTLGARLVTDITPADLRALLSPIAAEKPETARRVMQRVDMILRRAKGDGHRTDNPMDAIAADLRRMMKQAHAVDHHTALEYGAVAAAISTVRASGAYEATKLAFEFLVLTAARSGEVRGAHWEEIDLDVGDWSIPAERMKSRRKHRVPLSPQALYVLRKAEALSDHTGLVFPSITGRQLSDATLSKLLRELGVNAVPHGFRASFRMWAGEETVHAREVCEHALAHIPESRVELAYTRSAPLMKKRRALMEDWANYVSPNSDVTPLAVGSDANCEKVSNAVRS